MSYTYSEHQNHDLDHKLKSAKQVSIICSPKMMQNMKKIFQICLCIAYLMLAPINDNYTAIIEKKNVRNKKWIYNVDDKKKETVSSRNNFQNVYTSDLYFDLKIAFLATIPILLLYIMICCYFSNFKSIDVNVDKRKKIITRKFSNRIFFNDKKKTININNFNFSKNFFKRTIKLRKNYIIL
ncbi:hypothetical protein ACFW04_002307 [Cataglyphis niger]